MTRKDELELRAAQWLQHHGDQRLTRPLAALLEQVDREVWEKAARLVEDGRFISDSSMEYVWAKHVASVLRKQQELA